MGALDGAWCSLPDTPRRAATRKRMGVHTPAVEAELSTQNECAGRARGQAPTPWGLSPPELCRVDPRLAAPPCRATRVWPPQCAVPK